MNDPIPAAFAATLTNSPATRLSALVGLVAAKDEYLIRNGVEHVDELPEGDPIGALLSRAEELSRQAAPITDLFV